MDETHFLDLESTVLETLAFELVFDVFVFLSRDESYAWMSLSADSFICKSLFLRLM